MNRFLIDKNGNCFYYDQTSIMQSYIAWYYVEQHDGQGLYVRLHREDDPAIIRTDGYKAYYFRGFSHREGGPAIITSYGVEYYFDHGSKHREDGPVVMYSNGCVKWYLYNNELKFVNWCTILNKTPEEIACLRLKYDV